MLACGLALALAGCESTGDTTQPGTGNTPGQDDPTPSQTLPAGTVRAVGGTAPAVTQPIGSLLLSATKEDDPSAAGQSSFDINSLRELHVQTVWHNVTGQHVELRKFYAPDGSLYSQKLVAFATDIASPQPYQAPVGIPSARDVQPATAAADGSVMVWDYLPVGGTWITQHNLLGAWKIEVTLDPFDANTKGPTTAFELQQPQ